MRELAPNGCGGAYSLALRTASSRVAYESCEMPLGGAVRQAAHRHALRLILLLCAIACVIGNLACGSESSIRTFAPADARCAVQAQADTASFSAAGGTGLLRITTNRECAWTVQKDVSWLALQAGASGQGETSVPFTVAANSDPPTRSARLAVNDQAVHISQAGKACTFNLSSTRETIAASGEQRT